MRRILDYKSVEGSAMSFERILSHALCTQSVLAILGEMMCRDGLHMQEHRARLPKRLFKSLAPKDPGEPPWTKYDYPLPFLKHLYSMSGVPRFEPNANSGYALTQAVYSTFTPLVRFLLKHGADPGLKDGRAVRVAIRQNDLALVKMLVEPIDVEVTNGRKRRVKEPLTITEDMRLAAIETDAKKISQYLIEDKFFPPVTTSRKRKAHAVSFLLPAVTSSDKVNATRSAAYLSTSASPSSQ